MSMPRNASNCLCLCFSVNQGRNFLLFWQEFFTNLYSSRRAKKQKLQHGDRRGLAEKTEKSAQQAGGQPSYFFSAASVSALRPLCWRLVLVAAIGCPVFLCVLCGGLNASGQNGGFATDGAAAHSQQ